MKSSLERLATRLLFAAPVNGSNSMSSPFMRCLFACASYDTLLKLPGNPRYATLTKTTGAHNVTSLAASRGSPAAGVVEPVLRAESRKIRERAFEVSSMQNHSRRRALGSLLVVELALNVPVHLVCRGKRSSSEHCTRYGVSASDCHRCPPSVTHSFSCLLA